MKFIKNFINDEAGVTAIEYGLIAALIAVIAITAITDVGVDIKAVFDKVAATINVV